MNDKIPLVHTAYTPIKPKRTLSVGVPHIKRLEAIMRAYNQANKTALSPEDMNRALIDREFSGLK
jgi:hypothetical protein